jgi:PAS domain S-box-containing protein
LTAAYSDEDVTALRRRLADAESLLEAIREGRVDALVVNWAAEEHIFTLESADLPYRRFLEQMSEGAVSLDSSGQIVYCNRFFAELVKTPREELAGVALERFVTPASLSDYRAALEGDDVHRVGIRLSVAGVEVPVQLAVSPVGSEQARRFTVVVTDLSERERLQTLSALQEASEAASLAKDHFLARVGHELRTPLQVVKGWTQFLLRRSTELDDRTQKALETIDRSVDMQRKLIEDLLDLSRIASGKMRLERVNLDASQLAAGVAASLVLSAEAKQIELTLAAPRRVHVEADPHRLEQVLNNLIGNAIKFTPRGGHVRVTVAEDHGTARIAVIDDGRGIDGPMLSRVFQLFSQKVDEDAGRDGGLGLGLAISKQLVELHGGSLHVRSDGRDRGSTFTIELPALAGAADRPSFVPRRGLSLKDRRILVIDDEKDARDVVARLLAAAEAEVVTAPDVPTALARLEQESFDAIVSDLLMPGIDGLELAREVRKRHGETRPLVALSGLPGADVGDRARAAGFSAFVAKPVGDEELVSKLAQLIGSLPAA